MGQDGELDADHKIKKQSSEHKQNTRKEELQEGEP